YLPRITRVPRGRSCPILRHKTVRTSSNGSPPPAQPLQSLRPASIPVFPLVRTRRRIAVIPGAIDMNAGPHAAIPVSSPREQFCGRLFDRLWETYRRRVSYVQTYEQVIRDARATFVNDHIAFRTFACQQPHV